jgi:hypothetical protein
MEVSSMRTQHWNLEYFRLLVDFPENFESFIAKCAMFQICISEKEIFSVMYNGFCIVV